MTAPIKILDVKPRIPETLQGIKDLSENLWFVWDHDARELFRRMDPELWDETRRNPVELLSRLSQKRLEDLARDEGFLAQMARVRQEFDRYMSEKADFSVFGGGKQPFLVAYLRRNVGLETVFPSIPEVLESFQGIILSRPVI